MIERAAILASGHDASAVLRWIDDHAGEPEAPAAAPARGGGLHSARTQDVARSGARAPLRYVLPRGTLS